jgi:hypothetical protein
LESEQVDPNPSTLTVIQHAFESAGVEFRPDGSVFPGVWRVFPYSDPEGSKKP